MLRKALLLGIGVLVGVTFSASASVPDSSGLIHGCYANTGGALRVVDPSKGQHCNRTTQTPLNWGLPKALAAIQVGVMDLPSMQEEDVLMLTLPAGTYSISAAVIIDASPTTEPQATVECTLDGGDTTDDATTSVANPDGASQSHATLPMLEVTHVNNGGYVRIACEAMGGANGDVLGAAEGARITAIPVTP